MTLAAGNVVSSASLIVAEAYLHRPSAFSPPSDIELEVVARHPTDGRERCRLEFQAGKVLAFDIVEVLGGGVQKLELHPHRHPFRQRVWRSPPDCR